MFGKKKKETISEDKIYHMKDEYKADELFIANFQRLSSDIISDGGPIVETTEQSYIFEVVAGDKIRYREIFTGFIAEDNKVNYFNLPYVVNAMPFTNYFPDTVGINLPKLSLIWLQNDINYPKQKSKIYKNNKSL